MTEAAWTGPGLLELSGSYWQATTLHAGVELDLFSALEEGAAPVADLAKRVGCDARALGMLLEALATMGLLEKAGTAYANTPAASRWLCRQSPAYQGYIIRHHHHLMEAWARLPEAVRRGEPVREPTRFREEEWREAFLMGMFNLASALAPHVAGQIDLGGCRRLLDLGGGPGTYAIHFCQANPGLTATVFDLPATRSFAEQTIARFGLQERITFRDGDFLRDGIPGRYDVAWLSHILHGEGPEGCARILERAASALEPGGRILVQEFILDDHRPGPLFPALFALNMLVGTDQGRSYREGELREMLAAAGGRDIERLSLAIPGPTGILSARL